MAISSSIPHRVSASPPVVQAALFPFLDLKTQFARIKNEVLAEVERVLDSQYLILGPEVEALEAEVARIAGSEFAIGCASGSDALLLALLALGVHAGDEVITTPFTFVATAGSIARLQAQPVFVDIDPETYDLDIDQLESAITARTKAIIPVHLFGLPAEMKSILAMADANGLAVIEDAAQSIAARYQDKRVGSIGNIGCFSFFPSKNLGGAGDGGMLTTSDPELADRLKVLRVHGSREKYHYERLGINSRLDALQAAILRVKLRHLADWTAARQRNAERYRNMFAELGLDSHLQLPAQPRDRVHVYNQFVIRTPQRDALSHYLRAAGVPTEIYYPSPLHLQPAFAYLGYKEADFPQAELASQEVLALPIFPELTEDQQFAVANAIASFHGIAPS
ncbi:MAG: putative aminotransferase [Acidobacteriaceae bacterium]|nr:putative aminotransferase [Acidobacteriaceae bacterium]